MSLEQIVEDGFVLGSDGKEQDELKLAMNSLKIALKAYFSSHIAFNIKQNDELADFQDDKKIIGKYLGYSSYPEVFFTTIVNMQHFFELILKNLLEKENVLYSLKTLNDITLVDKLIHSEKVDDPSGDSIEFGEALKRIKKLVGDNRIRVNNDEQLKKFLGYKIKSSKGQVEFVNSQILESLNKLRNRLWHKGLFILSYKSFDIFMIKYMLPIINDVFSIDSLKVHAKWKYNVLSCNDDPISLLIQEGKKHYNINKIAVIKEMGRAAYNNKLPISTSPVARTIRIREIQRVLPSYDEFDEIYHKEGIWDCPICGLHSFIGHIGDFDVDIDEPPFSYPVSFLDNIECLYCNFKIDRKFNTNDLGLNIQRYEFD